MLTTLGWSQNIEKPSKSSRNDWAIASAVGMKWKTSDNSKFGPGDIKFRRRALKQFFPGQVFLENDGRWIVLECVPDDSLPPPFNKVSSWKVKLQKLTPEEDKTARILYE